MVLLDFEQPAPANIQILSLHIYNFFSIAIFHWYSGDKQKLIMIWCFKTADGKQKLLLSLHGAWCQFSTNHCQTWQFYLLIGALSSGVDEFLLTCLCQKLKKKNKQKHKQAVGLLHSVIQSVTKIQFLKVSKFYRRLYDGWHKLAPHHTDFAC